MSSKRIGRRDFLKAAWLAGSSVACAGIARPISLAGQPTRQASSSTNATRKFSLAYLTLFGCPPPEMIYIAARAGYDFVSLRPIYMALPGEPNFDLAANPRLLAQTRAALSATGLRVHDIELARVQDGTDPKSYVPALEIGAELGARHVISSIWTRDTVFAKESFAMLCDLAKPVGLTVDLEFVTFAAVKTLSEALEVLRSVRRDNSGLLVDVLHFSRSRVGLGELDAVPREWFHFTHVNDAPAQIPATDEGLIHTAREERLYPGEGGIDIAAILDRIPDVPCSIELPNTARVKELGYAEHAFRCLETTKAYLKEHLDK